MDVHANCEQSECSFVVVRGCTNLHNVYVGCGERRAARAPLNPKPDAAAARGPTNVRSTPSGHHPPRRGTLTQPAGRFAAGLQFFLLPCLVQDTRNRVHPQLLLCTVYGLPVPVLSAVILECRRTHARRGRDLHTRRRPWRGLSSSNSMSGTMESTLRGQERHRALLCGRHWVRRCRG